jgi:hypothetical protein
MLRDRGEIGVDPASFRCIQAQKRRLFHEGAFARSFPEFIEKIRQLHGKRSPAGDTVSHLRE